MYELNDMKGSFSNKILKYLGMTKENHVIPELHLNLRLSEYDAEVPDTRH